jgi:predicted phosphodiesterase
MTRLAILSDIHGNLPGLEAIIEDMAQFQPDHVISAGDQINVGPFSAQVMQRIHELGWTMIRGNHEYYLLEFNTPREPESRRGWVTLRYLAEQLAGRWYNTIAAMPDELTLVYPDGPPIRVMHGLPGDVWNSLHRLSSDDEVRRKLAGVAEPTVIAGHYHLPFEKRVDGRQVLNPGSVGLPMDGRSDASYLILDSTGDGWQATFRRVPVDLEPVFAEFERQRFVENCGVIGYLIVQQFKQARTVIAAYDRWRSVHCPDRASSIELVDEFLASGAMWANISAAYRYNEHL